MHGMPLHLFRQAPQFLGSVWRSVQTWLAEGLKNPPSILMQQVLSGVQQPPAQQELPSAQQVPPSPLNPPPGQ
jgi:hypothetical protein